MAMLSTLANLSMVALAVMCSWVDLSVVVVV
jgi:hypothetical protein